jgi:hypothetical protein
MKETVMEWLIHLPFMILSLFECNVTGTHTLGIHLSTRDKVIDRQIWPIILTGRNMGQRRIGLRERWSRSCHQCFDSFRSLSKNTFSVANISTPFPLFGWFRRWLRYLIFFISQVHLFSKSFSTPYNFFTVVLNYVRTLIIKLASMSQDVLDDWIASLLSTRSNRKIDKFGHVGQDRVRAVRAAQADHTQILHQMGSPHQGYMGKTMVPPGCAPVMRTPITWDDDANQFLIELVERYGRRWKLIS